MPVLFHVRRRITQAQSGDMCANAFGSFALPVDATTVNAFAASIQRLSGIGLTCRIRSIGRTARFLAGFEHLCSSTSRRLPRQTSFLPVLPPVTEFGWTRP